MGLIRKPHRLKPNKTAALPAKVIFVDTETTTKNLSDTLKQHDLKLGVSCCLSGDPTTDNFREQWADFYDVDFFWEWALSKVTTKRRVVIMAHNLDFDFLVLNGLNMLRERDWFPRHMIVSGNVDIWTFVKYKYRPECAAWKNYVKRYKKDPRPVKSVVFIDLMNYFKMSLKKLGDKLDVPKMDINFDTCSDRELLEYCRNDVRIMVEAWKTWHAFLRDHKLGVWAKTLPGQAFNAYRHRFMPYDIYLHSHPDCLNLERSGYFGGRTECFQIGTYKRGPYYLLDVNSLYPYVMRNNKYPVRMITYWKKGTVKEIKHYGKEYGIMAEVTVKVKNPCIPYRYGGRLTFPVGQFCTTLTNSELLLAIREGKILRVGRTAVYETQPIFRDYVSFFWEKRSQYKRSKDTAYDEICKLLMNSLYGKFGQLLDDYVYFADDPSYGIGYHREYDMDEHRWVRFKQMNGKVEVFNGKDEAYNSFPAIAAFVTAYARTHLWEIISSVPHEHRFYCDTDSIIVDQSGYEILKNRIDDYELGALKLARTSKTMTINNVKDYIFNNKRKLKGVKTTIDDMYATAISQWHQVGMRSVLWGSNDDVCLWQLIEKHIAGTYRKGTVQPDGKVIPLIFSES